MVPFFRAKARGPREGPSFSPACGDLNGYAQVTPQARARAARKAHVTRSLRGDNLSRTSSHASAMPWCDDPVLVGARTRGQGKLPSVETSGYFPCRKCEKCITFRRLRWRDRTRRELAKAVRSWFVTLTFSDIHLAGIRLAAAMLSQYDHETALERAAYSHVQRYLKRVRKAGRTQFRYFAIFEYGSENGRGHYHLFIHEKPGCKPVLKRTLDEQWRSFVSAKLVDTEEPGAASYVCKYLTKSPVNRPRASTAYGG